MSDLHTISTKIHAWPTFSFKPLLANATSSPGLKRLRLQRPQQRNRTRLEIDIPQTETSFGQGAAALIVAFVRAVLTYSARADLTNASRELVNPTRRSDHTFPSARNSRLRHARFGLRKKNQDDS